MNSITPLSLAYGNPYSAAGSGSALSKSVLKTADGTTITTIRSAQDAVISVTTAAPAAASPVPQATQSQATQSTVGITA